ncbi:hypothetical protein M0R45_031494 [Rubus argutus]|uniref:Uncharacterized protein n=1 Tax=Rubus argutus TaxID=59490 RepID=A0AAW1WDR5_RUBAR
MGEEDDLYVPVAKRRAIEAQRILEQRKRNSSSVLKEKKPEKSNVEALKQLSLLAKASKLKHDAPEITPTQELVQQEKEMIEHLSHRKTLMSVGELARGITYKDPLPTGWKPPLQIRKKPTKQFRKDIGFCVAIDHDGIAGGDDDANCSGRRAFRVDYLPVKGARNADLSTSSTVSESDDKAFALHWWSG